MDEQFSSCQVSNNSALVSNWLHVTYTTLVRNCTELSHLTSERSFYQWQIEKPSRSLKISCDADSVI